MCENYSVHGPAFSFGLLSLPLDDQMRWGLGAKGQPPEEQHYFFLSCSLGTQQKPGRMIPLYMSLDNINWMLVVCSQRRDGLLVSPLSSKLLNGIRNGKPFILVLGWSFEQKRWLNRIVFTQLPFRRSLVLPVNTFVASSQQSSRMRL